jgi:hypothetical protein
MISWGNIAGLFALTGLIVPLIIHLLSRKTRHSIPFGSLRFLDASETRTFKSLRLNEKLLLFIRALLITILVLMLADLKWLTRSPEKETLILVDPYYANYTGLGEMLDSIADESDVRWADRELTFFSEAPVPGSTVFHSRFFNSIPETDSVVVVSPALLSQFPNMPHEEVRVDRWLSLPENTYPKEMIITKGDSTALISIEMTRNALLVSHQKTDQKGKTVRIDATLNLPGNSQDQITAAIRALERSGWASYSVSGANDETKKETIQIVAGNTFGDPVVKISEGLVMVDSALTDREALAISFPLILEDFLTQNRRDSLENQLSLPNSLLPVRKTLDAGPRQKHTSAAEYLIWITLILLMVERTISYKKTAG